MKAADGLYAGVFVSKVYEATVSVAQQLHTVNNPDPAADRELPSGGLGYQNLKKKKKKNDKGILTDFLKSFVNMASVIVWTKFPTQIG